MRQEGQLLDKKSLCAVSGKTANWSELAKDCIAFTKTVTAKGGARFEGDKRWRRYWAFSQ